MARCILYSSSLTRARRSLVRTVHDRSDLPSGGARCRARRRRRRGGGRKGGVRAGANRTRVHDHTRGTRRGVLHPRCDGAPRAQPSIAYVTVHGDTLKPRPNLSCKTQLRYPAQRHWEPKPKMRRLINIISVPAREPLYVHLYCNVGSLQNLGFVSNFIVQLLIANVVAPA